MRGLYYCENGSIPVRATEDKLLMILFLFSILFYRCQNTTDIQSSKGIADSKKNSVFVKAYKLDSTTDKNIIVEEAWIEKIWYNNNNIIPSKITGDGCQLCFKLKNVPGLIYTRQNFLKWKIRFVDQESTKNGTYYVGFKGENYSYVELKDNPPSILKFDLISRKFGEPIKNDKIVGRIVFKAVSQ